MLVCKLRKWYSFHLTLSILFVIIDLNPKHFLFKKNNSVWPMCLCLICLVWNHLLCAWLTSRNRRERVGGSEEIIRHFTSWWKCFSKWVRKSLLDWQEIWKAYTRVNGWNITVFYGIKVKSQICLSKVVIIHTDWWFWTLSAFFSLSNGQWSVMVSDWVLSVMETCLSSKALCFKSVAYFKQLWRFPKLLQHHTMRAP